MEHTDIIIIGSGPGGYRAAAHAAQQGKSVTIVESGEYGGTCLNCGCIPTKALCHDAEEMAYTDMKLPTANRDLAFGKAIERKQQIVGQLRHAIDGLLQKCGVAIVHGHASFKDSRTIVVGDSEYTADNIIIATGSSAKMPPIDGIGLPGVLSSTELLDIDHMPSRLCIIGAGVIGMEFASIFSSFGCEVTVIEYLGECLPMLDSGIAKRLRQAIGKKGVEFSLNSAVNSIGETIDDKGHRQLTVSYNRKGKQQSAMADMVLVATGRKPNTDGLCLDKAGVEFTAKGIVVDDDFHTTAKGIYAIGDVNGRIMLAHAATFQGLHAVNRIVGRQDNIRFDIMPSAIFTCPEAACVGPTEDQLKAEGRAYECRKGFYRSNGKAMAIDATDGMIKLLVDNADNGRIIGCHVFGAHSSDIVQEVATLMNMGATTGQLADIIHIHPTLSEILHDMAM